MSVSCLLLSPVVKGLILGMICQVKEEAARLEDFADRVPHQPALRHQLICAQAVEVGESGFAHELCDGILRLQSRRLYMFQMNPDALPVLLLLRREMCHSQGRLNLSRGVDTIASLQHFTDSLFQLTATLRHYIPQCVSSSLIH